MNPKKTIIQGDGVKLEVKAAFHASSAKQKCDTKKCTVVIANVKEGKICLGETITIINRSQGRRPITDLVARLEIKGKEVPFAASGQSVGICLRNSNLKDILPLI